MIQDLIAEGTTMILKGLQERLGLDFDDVNFKDTPSRVSRMYNEICSGLKETDEQVEEILKSAFPCTNDHLIVIKDIEVFSLCPHHLLPVHYKIHVGYLPNGEVLGISKLPRLIEVLAKRPVLQEQLVEDVVSNLMKLDGCLGAGCVAEGKHYCMIMRGAKQSQSTTITSSMKGNFLENGGELKQEFLKLVYGGR